MKTSTIYVILSLLLGSYNERSILCRGAVKSIHKELLEYLFRNYNKEAKPIILPNSRINVTFGMRIRNILDLNARKQVLKSRLWVRQKWKNELLQWKPSEWGNITEIGFSPELIWLPDIVLYNSAGDTFPGGTEIYKTNVMAYPDGTQQWNSPASFHTSCKINVRYFPFDQQTCLYKFGSWAFDLHNIDIVPEPAEGILGVFVEGSEWKIHSPRRKRNEVKYICCHAPFVDVEFYITLQRKPMYYIFTLLLPCLLLLPLTSVSFYLPPESGERVGLTITILLAVAVFLQITTDTLPRFSENVPLVGLYFLLIMGTCSMSMISTGIVLLVHFKGEPDYAKAVPAWIRSFFFEKLAKYLCMRDIDHLYRMSQRKRPNSLRYGNGLVTQARASVEENQHAIKESDYRSEIKDLSVYPLANKHPRDGRYDTELLSKVLEEISYMSSQMKDQEERDLVIQEWRTVAKVLDRLILVIFIGSSIIMTACTLLPMIT